MFPNPIGAKQAVFGAATVSAAVSEAEWLKAYKEAVDQNGKPVNMAPLSEETIFDHKVADLQENIKIEGNQITGTLKYVASGKLVDAWHKHYFIALEFKGIPSDATSVKVGLEPSTGSGLVEIIDDPDKTGAFAITPDDNGNVVQKFIIKTTTPDEITTQTFEMKSLELKGVD